MNRIVASVLLVCCVAGCQQERPGPGSKLDTAFAYWMILVPVLTCADARMYRIGSSCAVPGGPYIYNQGTGSLAGTTVTGIVTLECPDAAGASGYWGKIASANPPAGSTVTYLTGSLTLSSYSVGDALFCFNSGLPQTFHKVAVQ